MIVQSELRRALVGIRSQIGRGVRVRDSLILGADYYETAEERQQAAAGGLPAVGIGDEAVVERAIVDKNARIGAGVRILNEAGIQEKDGEGYFIREGLVIVPKNGVLREGTVV